MSDEHLWVADGITQESATFERIGILLPASGDLRGPRRRVREARRFGVDSQRHLHTADVHVGRPQKYRPKPGADPAKRIGAAGVVIKV